MNSLSNNERFYIPNTLDGIDILTENITSNALLVDGSNFMMADLDAGGHNVKNVATATALDDAVPLGQLNNTLSNYVDLTTTQTIGGSKSFSNQVNFNGTTKTNLTLDDIPNTANRVALSTTGTQTIVGTKIWSNSQTFNGPSFTTAGTNVNINSTNLSVSATTTTNLNNGANCNNKNLTNVLDPVNAQDASTKNYVDASANLRVLKAGDTMTGQLVVNYTNAVAEIRANNETEDATLYLTTPYQNGAGRRKTAIIADGISTWNRADLHFCLNNTATHNNVSIADSRMCIINSTANVGIATTSPSEKLDVNGNGKIRGYLDMNTTNKIINLSNPTNAQDGATKNYVDTHASNTNYLLRDGTLPMTGNLDMNSSKIVNLSNGTNANDAINFSQITDLRTYTDNSLNLLRTYVDTQDTNERTYVDASLNLKVNRAGDTMTGSLNISLAGASTTINKQLNLQTNNNGLWFNPYFSGGAWNPLIQSGAKGIIFSNGTPNTGDLFIAPWSDYENGVKISSSGETTLNKNATNTQNQTTVITSFNISSSGTFYDYINFTGTSATVVIPKTSGGDPTMVNKVVYIYFPNTSTLTLSAAAAGSCVINGGSWSNYIINIGTGVDRRVKLVGLSTIGYYTVESGVSNVDSIDQLTLKSNYGLNVNNEFTGINFNNNNTDVGYIRVESNRLSNNDAIMSFQVRRSSTITNPLTLNDNINANVPIISNSTITANGVITRNAWSSGELIQTKIYTQNTNGSGVQAITANSNGTGAYVDWKTISFTTLNTPTDSILVVEVFAPYLYNGTLGDRLTSKIVDTTSSQTIVESGAAYINGGGGGARGLPFLPLLGSYTPTGTTKARSIKISFDNDGDDTLYICRILPRGSVITDKNNYTIKVSEYKL
jgi:hypothetical protein